MVHPPRPLTLSRFRVPLLACPPVPPWPTATGGQATSGTRRVDLHDGVDHNLRPRLASRFGPRAVSGLVGGDGWRDPTSRRPPPDRSAPGPSVPPHVGG